MPRLLAIYLHDHLAAATAGAQLARRVSRNNKGTDYGKTLAKIAEEIEEDRHSLRTLMRGLGVGQDRAKVAAAWWAEKVGRLKPNGRLLSYSPLSRVVELEALMVGVEAKLLLWQALEQVGDAGREAVAGFDLEELIKRGRSQRRRLRRLRLEAVDEALR